MNKNSVVANTVACLGFSFLLPMAANADTIGFEGGVYSWNQNFSGEIQSGPDVIDVEDTLGFDGESNNAFYFVLEHPVPFLPNVRLERTDMNVSATSTLSSGFDFDGNTYLAGATVDTDIDLTHTDATLYYEILDNWVSVDVGLTLRYFQSGVEIEEALAGKAEEDLDGVIPMLYGAVKFELPLTGLSVGARANALGYGDDTLLDYRVNLAYETTLGFGLELGYRSFELDFEDSSDEVVDLTIDGAYAGLYFHF